MSLTMPPKKKKPAKPPHLKTRALDDNAFRIFTRKAGPMKHRRAKRLAQRERRELNQDLASST